MSKATERRPHRIGLTGSIGMGKSTVAAMFDALGVPVFDADATVRRLQALGGAMLLQIDAAFPGVVDADGLDRARLGKRVFGDPAALARLEGIVHPAVAEAQAAFMATHRDQPIVVLDIPLLFEKGGSETVDTVLVVSAPAEGQRQRVMARPGMTAETFDSIVAAQTPDAEKRARADHVVDTGTTIAATRAQVASLVACLRQRLGA